MANPQDKINKNLSLEQAQDFVKQNFDDTIKLSWTERDSGDICAVYGCENPVKWKVADTGIKLCWLCSDLG